MTTAVALLAGVGLLVGLCLVFVRALATQASAHRTQTERAEARFVKEREAWARERQLLLNRIDPSTAQAVADPTLQPGKAFVSAVPYDDDEAYWQSRESREELADRLMAEELEERDGVTR